jgi:hypothetical protein
MITFLLQKIAVVRPPPTKRHFFAKNLLVKMLLKSQHCSRKQSPLESNFQSNFFREKMIEIAEPNLT